MGSQRIDNKKHSEIAKNGIYSEYTKGWRYSDGAIRVDGSASYCSSRIMREAWPSIRTARNSAAIGSDEHNNVGKVLLPDSLRWRKRPRK